MTVGRASKFSLLTIGGYVAAIVLPWCAAALSAHSPVLRETPLALSFACIVGIATLSTPGAAVVAVASATLAFNYYVAVPLGDWSISAHELLRTVVVLCVSTLIVLLSLSRRRAEEKLRKANQELRVETDTLVQAQQASRSVVWNFNSLTRNMDRHVGGAEVFGYTHAELAAMDSFIPLVHEDDRAAVLLAAEHTVRTGEPFVTEFRVIWPNGEIRWLESRGAPTKEDPTIWRGVTMDITDRKLAQEALMRSEKLSAAGRLAASIAHEMNNPLASVTNLVYLARQSAAQAESPDAATVRYLTQAEGELARVAQIASQTLRFHRQQTARVPVNLPEELRSLLLLYEARCAAAGIAVQFECDPCPPLLGYDSELRQVVNTLLHNAVDAMPHGGRLRVRVREVADFRPGRQGPAVRITVADTGSGMSRETQQRLFEPFFTTKDGTGAGLGLWVAHGIVKNHHGSLCARSTTRPGASGSVFLLLLPQL